MTSIFSEYELFNLPLDKIVAANRVWREGIKMHDQRWLFLILKYPNMDIDQYIIKNYPELNNQFVWEKSTANERMAIKFKHRKTQVPGYYAGDYHYGKYSRDLDPFYNDEDLK